MYPSDTEIRSTVDAINEYIRNELKQSHSSIEEGWVAEMLYKEYRMALLSCFPSDHSTLSKRVFNISQKRISSMYFEHEKHLEDIKDIGRPNDGGFVDGSNTSYAMPMERGAWHNSKGNDRDVWFRKEIIFNK